MTYEEIWALPRDRIEAFFDREAGNFPACTVTLKDLPPRPMGPWSIPQTLVRIEGPKEQAEKLYRRFFLTFVSAGG